MVKSGSGLSCGLRHRPHCTCGIWPRLSQSMQAPKRLNPRPRPPAARGSLCHVPSTQHKCAPGTLAAPAPVPRALSHRLLPQSLDLPPLLSSSPPHSPCAPALSSLTAPAPAPRAPRPPRPPPAAARPQSPAPSPPARPQGRAPSPPACGWCHPVVSQSQDVVWWWDWEQQRSLRVAPPGRVQGCRVLNETRSGCSRSSASNVPLGHPQERGLGLCAGWWHVLNSNPTAAGHAMHSAAFILQAPWTASEVSPAQALPLPHAPAPVQLAFLVVDEGQPGPAAMTALRALVPMPPIPPIVSHATPASAGHPPNPPPPPRPPGS